MNEKTAEKEGKGKEQAMEPARPSRALSPFEEMDRMFEGMFPRGWMRPIPSRPIWLRPVRRSR